MQTAIAAFSITKERDITWAAQRTRLLGTLAGLRSKSRNQLARAVTDATRAVLAKPLRGTIQFAVGSSDQSQFLEISLFGDSSDDIPTDLRESLQGLVDQVSIDFGNIKGVVVKLRKYLAKQTPLPDPEHIAEWGTMLATRSTEGVLVEAQSQLQKIKAFSGSARSEKKDAQVHELLALVASTTDNSVIIMDANGQVEWVNDSFTRLTGYELNEVRERKFTELMAGQATDPTVEKEILSAIQQGHGISRDLIRYRKDGTTYWELISLSPVFDKDGVATRWVSIGTDISARRDAEEALAQAKAIAEAASSAKSNFLANISHEIRTPMNAVLGMTDLVLATQLTAEQQEYLSIAKESAQALMSLLNDILDLSKIDAGKLEIDPVPFDMLRLLQITLKPFEKQAQRKGVQFKYTIQPEAPLHVVGDAVRFRQILVNLVSNAVKFTSQGSVKVSVEPQWESEDEVSFHISVCDTGIGMPKGTLQRIFDAFAQADASVTRKYGGTGLGLTISARLVELMEGRIWVQSQEGKGSSFHVSLQFAKTEEQQTKATLAHDGMTGTRLLGQAICVLRVLVADDNEANRTLVRRVLERRGHEVTMASNGREVLNHYSAEEFDIAILDVQMPDVDGFTVTRSIREKEKAGRRHLPLIALTAHAMPGDRERCLRAGMDAYLSKPIDARELYTLIESLGDADQRSREQVASARQSNHAFSTALARLEGDEELLREQMQFFLDESPDLMEQILTALDDGRLDLVRIAAHRLKGLAGTVDGGQLLLIANRIEESSVSESLNDATAVIDDLASALAQLTCQVGDYLRT
jgi:PAS domain S-box-containing protein